MVLTYRIFPYFCKMTYTEYKKSIKIHNLLILVSCVFYLITIGTGIYISMISDISFNDPILTVSFRSPIFYILLPLFVLLSVVSYRCTTIIYESHISVKLSKNNLDEDGKRQLRREEALSGLI